MIELISLIAKSLVKQPDAVSVTMVQKGNVEVYELHVCTRGYGVKSSESKVELQRRVRSDGESGGY